MRDEDLELRFSDANRRLHLISGKQGSFAQFESLAEGQRQTITLLFDRNQLLLSHTDHPGKFQVDLSNAEGSIRLTHRLAATTEPERVMSTAFTGVISSEREEGTPVVSHLLDTSPAGWLAFAYKEQLDLRFMGSELIANHENHRFAIDSESGKILELGYGEDCDINFRAGLFAQAREKVIAECASKPNLFRRDQPATSLARYMSHPTVWNHIAESGGSWSSDSQELNPDLNSAVQKLIDGGVLSLADMVLNEIVSDDEKEAHRFSIPSDKPPAFDSYADTIRHAGAKAILKQASNWFDVEEDRWPWQVVRESCLMLIGRQQHSGKVLTSIYADPRNGPLCHGSIAFLLKSIGNPASSRFAKRALETLGPAQFARDYEALAEVGADRAFTEMLQAIQSLTQEELDAVLELNTNESLAKVVRAVHGIPIKHADHAGKFWYEISKDRLQATLESMRR